MPKDLVLQVWLNIKKMARTEFNFCYRVWTVPTNHVTKCWYPSTLKVTFTWQPARLGAKDSGTALQYSDEASQQMLNMKVCCQDQHLEMTISLTACVGTNLLTGFWATGSIRQGLKEAASWSTLSVVILTLLILISFQVWKERFPLPQCNREKVFCSKKWTLVQDLV